MKISTFVNPETTSLLSVPCFLFPVPDRVALYQLLRVSSGDL